MSTSFGTDRAITFRQPATANLLIDSKDRNISQYSSPFDFQITRSQQIQNGFMTRVGTTEVVLEWYTPNISEALGNNTLVVDISGTGLVSGHQIVFPDNFFTVAQAFTFLVDELNDLSGTSGVTFDIVTDIDDGYNYSLLATGGEFIFTENTPLLVQLKLLFGATVAASVPSMPLYDGIDLRPYRYIDFTSAQLTYNQDLKDNSTASVNRDVLCRWYMAYDNQTPNTNSTDEYRYPVLMGYEPFVIRRLFNPPKQIKWDSSQPIGNLSFQVFGSDGTIVREETADYNSQWLMTLQLSEN